MNKLFGQTFDRQQRRVEFQQLKVVAVVLLRVQENAGSTTQCSVGMKMALDANREEIH